MHFFMTRSAYPKNIKGIIISIKMMSLNPLWLYFTDRAHFRLLYFSRSHRLENDSHSLTAKFRVWYVVPVLICLFNTFFFMFRIIYELPSLIFFRIFLSIRSLMISISTFRRTKQTRAFYSTPAPIVFNWGKLFIASFTFHFSPHNYYYTK